MKEQDAAHSLEDLWETFIEDYAFQVPYNGSNKFYNDDKVNDHRLKEAVRLLYEKHFMGNITELTRLRSELKNLKTHLKIEIEANEKVRSELQQAKEEIESLRDQINQ